MYATSNNVTISGVSTGITTTLNGAITADATSLTLTSGTNFDDTSGKYSRTAANEYHIKIGDEIMKYTTISGTAVSSLTRGQQGTTAVAHADGDALLSLAVLGNRAWALARAPWTSSHFLHLLFGPCWRSLGNSWGTLGGL